MPHCRSVLSNHGKILYTLSEYYSLLCIFFLDCSFLLFLNPYIVVIYVQSSVDFKLCWGLDSKSQANLNSDSNG